MTHFVDDLAGLGVDRRIVLLGLQIGEHLERRAGELRAEDERLQAGDDRVAAEDRHEPRHACTGKLPDPRAVGLHPQGREVVDRLAERVPECVPRRPQLRHTQLPGGERVSNPTHLFAEAALREARRHELSVR